MRLLWIAAAVFQTLGRSPNFGYQLLRRLFLGDSVSWSSQRRVSLCGSSVRHAGMVRNRFRAAPICCLDLRYLGVGHRRLAMGIRLSNAGRNGGWGDFGSQKRPTLQRNLLVSSGSRLVTKRNPPFDMAA